MKFVHDYPIQYAASTAISLACTHLKHNWKLEAAPVELDFLPHIPKSCGGGADGIAYLTDYVQIYWRLPSIFIPETIS